MSTTIKTNRGPLTIGEDGAIDGLWRVCERELMTGAQVRKLSGRVTRSTFLRWREKQGFPAPVLKFPGVGGVLELWARTAVEAWLRER